MAVSIKKGFNDAKKKLDSLKKLNEVKGEYERRIDNFTNNLQKKADNIQINLDSANTSRKIKSKIDNSFEQLIDMIKTSSSNRTVKDVIDILKDTLQELPQKIDEIVISETISALGCSQDQTYQTNQEIFIPVSSIDVFKQLQFDPSSILGSSIYEKKEYVSQSDTPPKSTNRFFYQVIQGNGQTFTYNGASGQPLFNISYETFNGIEQGNYFKVTLLDRINSANHVSQFLVDYYKSLKIFDFNNSLTKIVDLVLNTFSVDAKIGPATLDDQKKFYVILQRILGMCFDFSQEIDVGGISKYPEYDDTTDSLFEFTPLDLSIIENEINIIRSGVVEFVDCNNIQLPVTNTDYVSQIITEVNDDGSNASQVIQDVFFNLSNDARWQLQLPQIFNASYNENIIKNYVQGVISSILSPKVIFPLMVMGNAIYLTVDGIGSEISEDLVATSPGLVAFSKKNKKFLINIASKISAEFVEGLFNQIRKDIIKLTQDIIFDIIKSKNEKVAIITDSILSQVKLIVQGGINLIQDYRECKSLLDYLFAILSLSKTGIQNLKIKNELVPTPLLLLSQVLTGSNPDRELINYIEQMQSLGLPVGTGLNGEPDLATTATFAAFQSQFLEKAQNGKIEGVVYMETIAPTGQPTGVMRVTGKPL